MADDDAPEITEETKKDREEAEQAKALNAVTDNVSGSSRGVGTVSPRHWCFLSLRGYDGAHDEKLKLVVFCTPQSAGTREAAG